MFRKIFRPRLWWLLVLPLAFYLTRYVTVQMPSGNYREMSLDEYGSRREELPIEEYRIFGVFFPPNAYNVWQFAANACLIIGCLSVGKELFLKKSSAPTT